MPSPPYTPYSYSPEKPTDFQVYHHSPTFNQYQLPQQPAPPTSYMDNQSECSYSSSPTKSRHRMLATSNQSSMDSQHELSPPFSAGGYSFPTPSNSPSNTLVYGSPADSSSCPYNSPPPHHSPYAEASLPYLENLPGIPTLTADAQAVFMPTDTGFSDCPYPTGDTSFVSMTTTELFPNGAHQSQLITIKQDLRYQDPMFPSASTRQPESMGYAMQAKARYTRVAVAGGRPDEKRQPKIEGMDIKGISKWLQESAPVH